MLDACKATQDLSGLTTGATGSHNEETKNRRHESEFRIQDKSGFRIAGSTTQVRKYERG
jgi:hypothetical protein